MAKYENRLVRDPEFIELIDKLLAAQARAFRCLTVGEAAPHHRTVADLKARLINRNERRTRRAVENVKALKRVEEPTS
jgi:hypothetical protein